MSSRLTKGLSLFLGVLMFMFGFLKFFEPFHGWFDSQIELSHLPHAAIMAGKLTEMMTGVLFLLPWFGKSLSARSKEQMLFVACLLLVSQMVVAIYVHLQPAVPASVLPLGIKTPVIPGFVLLLDLVTAVTLWKGRQAQA